MDSALDSVAWTGGKDSMSSYWSIWRDSTSDIMLPCAQSAKQKQVTTFLGMMIRMSDWNIGYRMLGISTTQTTQQPT